uniref:Protein lava lamp-like n=2 Tax=Cuerna arida TaxID=1464854 RepID=A0A1B6F2P0_9HEMI
MEDNPQNQEQNVNPSDQPPGTGVNLSLSEIEALRDRIEQQKANKLKAEQLVSTLSRIKAKEKATRRSPKTPGDKKIDDGISPQPAKRSGTNSSNALKERTNLLKKKLEEDRAKFKSKREQDDLCQVSQIVEHIKVQLEDQDKTIQQMHSNFAASTRVPPPVEEVTPAELDIPPEVKQKIADLELKILDLQENLREKDSVISARTQAITLLSEDMARKGKNTLDTLEETRTQMKTMQANFVALEDRMNEERTRLREELDAKKVKLQQLEKNYRAAESARFDLSTRVAELQEKVVLLQTKNIALEEEVAEFSSKSKELNETLENSNKQMIKMKAQFKSKLRAVEEERDMLRKEERTNEELNRLRERIADLEDEKEAGHLLKERITEMEEKLNRQECDLDNHIKAITLLEAEKLDLMEVANKNKYLLDEKENLIKSLQSQIAQIEECKITAEMKCLELEEKLDGYMKTESNVTVLNSELDKAKQTLLEYQATINELNMKLQSKENMLSGSGDELCEFEGINETKNLQDVSSSLREWQERYHLLEDKLNTTLAYCEELENKKKTVEIENERLLNECENLKVANDILQKQIHTSDTDTEVLKQTLAQKEVEISNVTEHNKTLESEVDNLRCALQSTTEELHILSQQLEELTRTRQRVEELSVNLDGKDKELEQTASELEVQTRKLSEYKKFHRLKSEDVIRISQELENVTSSSQQKIAELEASLNVARKNEEDLRIEIQNIKEHGIKGSDSDDKKMQEQSLKMKKLAASVKLKTKLVKDLEAKIGELENTFQQKDIIIKNLESEKMNLQKQLVENSQYGIALPSDSINLEEKFKSLEIENSSLKEDLKSTTDELECLTNASSGKHETLLQIKELENQNKKLSDISETKSDQLRKMEDDMRELNVLNKSLLSELEQMQETYKQDALKNESVLSGFEHEMLGNKKDILELGNQLMDVTSKYEQTWAKLQEKEVYIEDLEQQLEKAKSRLLQIENTVEERRRSLEEKAEMLGARLCQVEKNNEQLEKHEDELEQKIFNLLNTEEMLSTIIQKLQEDNSEISKLLNESMERNAQLSKELDSEQNKVRFLRREFQELQLSIVNYEKMFDEFKTVKIQLKENQESHENNIKYLENCLKESEQNMESEVQRLLDRISVIEGEREETVEKYNSLLVEKQTLEEEIANLHQTISDVTKEELEQLKINHKSLAEQLNIELEKRQSHIQRIQELETQLLLLTTRNTESPAISYNEEIVQLKAQLDREIKEKEALHYELLKEKATNHVDSVITKAEETYFTMTSPSENEPESKASFFFELELNAAGSNSDPVLFNKNQEVPVNKMSELENKLLSLMTENDSLKLKLQELECCAQNPPENSGGLMENEDWAAVSKDEDDGWGWGSKDAMLEHEYIQKQKINFELETKVAELEKKLYDLEEENSRVTEELKASQSKCSKLLKKVKEFKIKSESLERNSREKSVGFDDLDITMQEELRSQIEKLEKSLKEYSTNLNTLQQEREGFLKRIDTLTSGNERLVEMKERQDIEVEMWQRRSNELQNKIQGLEWKIAELHDEQTELKELEGNSEFSMQEKQQFLSNALEMEEKLNALAAENDYLQSLIADLKDREKTSSHTSVTPTFIDSFNQQHSTEDKYSQLKQENDRLNIQITALEEKLNSDRKQIDDSLIKPSCQVGVLLKGNEILNTTIGSMNDQAGLEDNQSLKERCNLLESQNDALNSIIFRLNDDIGVLRIKYNASMSQINDYVVAIEQLKMEGENSKSTKNKETIENVIQTPSSDESPSVFRGFTSTTDSVFEDISNTQSNPLFASKASGDVSVLDFNKPVSESRNNQVDFFDTIIVKPESVTLEGSQAQSLNMPVHTTEIFGESHAGESDLDKYLTEIKRFEMLLGERECELNSLKDSLFRLQDENNKLRQQVEKQTVKKPLTWGPASMFSTEYVPDSFQWGVEIDANSKTLNETEATVNVKDTLGDQSNEFSNSDQNLDMLSSTAVESFHGLFSQSEDTQERQINSYVEQITQLTKTLSDKEIEIETLIDKKKKYKEMYYALAKEYDVQSSDHSNVDKHLTDQNTLLHQLLEDKETELEIMNQQIDQTKVARENLQDELSLTLCEMEAANSSYSNPQLRQQIMLPSTQPENIEDVRTLCSEVAELTKLLQEKESEVEVLKQQLEELALEKENLLDEWKKESEIYKANIDTSKTQEMEVELENYKEMIVKDIEKQMKDELSLKNQQIMNVMNDLHNTNSVCQDLQSKLNDLENHLKTCNLQNEHLQRELHDLKDFQNSIQLLTQDVTCEIEMNLAERVKTLKDDLVDMKLKFEEAKSKIEEKDKEILNLKEKVKELENSCSFDEKMVSDQPLTPVQMKTFASEPFRISTEQSSSDDDSSSKHMETIQGQMVLMKEIQSLKQVLSMKDTEITRLSIALNDAQENLIRGEMRFINSEEENLRSRLDEALYTLHLRDVRCDELALELMQLLEERDSLQLRLSTAIRFNEELRKKSKLHDEAAVKIEGDASPPLAAEDDGGKNDQLKQKLDQLHNVGYRRDPGLQQDQQKRHHEQMHLFTHQTTQDESQHSSGFFNWIFGSSPSSSQDV